MAKVRINKLDAAVRQINAAIRMCFGTEDIVAVHSVASAAHRIIRDICEERGDIESYARFTDWIAPGYEKEFWGAVNKSANFFKHADRDKITIHEFDERETDFVILMACKWYRDLGFSPSDEMLVFAAWMTMCRPDLIMQSIEFELNVSPIKAKFEETAGTLKKLPRKEQLRFGLLALQQRKARSSSAPRQLAAF